MVEFCDYCSLDLDHYVEGLVSNGPLEPKVVDTLVKYHEYWIRQRIAA